MKFTNDKFKQTIALLRELTSLINYILTAVALLMTTRVEMCQSTGLQGLVIMRPFIGLTNSSDCECKQLHPDWKKLYQLVERRDSCNVYRHNGSIIEDPLKPLDTILMCCSSGFRSVLNLGPHCTERCQSLGQLYA